MWNFVPQSHIIFVCRVKLYSCSGYNRYSFGIGPYIGIGRYIGLTDKENSLSVLVLADTVFYMGTFTDTEKESDLVKFGDFMVNTKVLEI